VTVEAESEDEVEARWSEAGCPLAGAEEDE